MGDATPPARPPGSTPAAKPALERWMELWLFRSRWLLAPLYIGLVLALVALVVVFVREAAHELAGALTMSPEQAILMALSLIDLSLAGNLLLIVIFSGYENFVSKIHVEEAEDRPDWMGTIDFSGLKMKLIASIVAISAIALLRAFMKLSEGEAVTDRDLIWMVGLHLTFLTSGVMLALMDFISARTEKH